MRPRVSRVLLASSALSLLQCGPAQRAEGATVYATVARPEQPAATRALTLDLARPSAAGPRPALIFVHGGAWAFGDLSTFRPAIAEAAQRGYVALTINYRLTDLRGADGRPLHPWPTQIRDVRCAIRWLAHNAAELHVDPQRVAIVGESAGAHLAMMAAFARDEPRFEPTECPYAENLAVKAVVSMAGPGDLHALYQQTVWWIRPRIVDLLALPDAAAASGASAVMDEASPWFYLSRGPRVALLIEQGTADELVPHTMQRRFVALAQSLGHDVTYNEIPGEGHAAVTPGLAHAWGWLESHL